MRSKDALRRWFEENYPNRVVDVQIPYDARCGPHTHTHTHTNNNNNNNKPTQIRKLHELLSERRTLKYKLKAVQYAEEHTGKRQQKRIGWKVFGRRILGGLVGPKVPYLTPSAPLSCARTT